LRDLALRRGFQNYTLAVFWYLFFLLLISKALGLGLDYYDSGWSEGFSSPRKNCARGCGMKSKAFWWDW